MRPALLDMTGCVLAGGRSRRMGRDKATIELGGRSLAAIAVERLRGLFKFVLVATNDPAPFSALGIDVVADRLGTGPLAGVAAAIARAPTEYVFCCAVDMPGIESDLVRLLCAHAPGHDAVVPRSPRGLEPLCAVYARRCLGPFEARLRAGELALEAALDGLALRVLSPSEVHRADPTRRSFVNLNTPEELRLFEETSPGLGRS